MPKFMPYAFDTPTHLAVCLGELMPDDFARLPAWEVERAIATPPEYRASVSFFNGRLGDRVAYFLRPKDDPETQFEKDEEKRRERFNQEINERD